MDEPPPSSPESPMPEGDWMLAHQRPAEDGLSFRCPAGEQDAEALAAIHAGRAVRDAIDPLSMLESVPTVEELHTRLAQLSAEGQLERWLIAEIAGQAVGYSLIDSWHDEDNLWVYLILGWVLPDWRGHGIGTALLRWGQQAVRRLAALENPGEVFEFAGSAGIAQIDASNLLLNEGFSVGYSDIEMSLDPAAPLGDCPLPAGVELRPAVSEHIPLIADSIAEAYRHEFPGNRFRSTQMEAAGQAEWYSSPVHDRTLWQVAWDGARVVGQVLPMIERGRGIIDEVSVRPGWRRKGLARALLIRGLRALRSRDVGVIRLITVAGFPTRARDLYASVGFRVVNEFRRYRKPAG